MLEDGRYASVSDIARAEKIDRTYAGDILRLTLLAPEIVEAIVEGRHPSEMTLPVLLKPFALEWGATHQQCAQRDKFELSSEFALRPPSSSS